MVFKLLGSRSFLCFYFFIFLSVLGRAVNPLFPERHFDSVFHRSMASALQCLWHDEMLLTLYARKVWAACNVPW